MLNIFLFEGLLNFCICLSRFIYSNELYDLERMFGLNSPYLSVISSQVISSIVSKHRRLLQNLNNLILFNESKL